MQKATLACLVFAGIAVAQNQVLPGPHGATYNGFSRGMSYTAQSGHAIVQFELPTDSHQAGDEMSLAIWVNGTLVEHSYGNQQPNAPTTVTPVNIGPVVINAGDDVVVIGNWSPTQAGMATAHNSYNVGGGGTYTVNIEGSPTTIYRAGVQHDVGDPTFASLGLLPFSGITGSIGRIILYTTDLTNYALQTEYGEGCINDPRMVWEVQAENTPCDLIGKSYFFTYNPTTDRYDISEVNIPYDPTATATSLNNLVNLPYSSSSSANPDDATWNVDLTAPTIPTATNTPMPPALAAGIQFPGGSTTDLGFNSNAKVYYGPATDNSFATNGSNYQDFLPFQGLTGAGHAVLCMYNCDIDPSAASAVGMFLDQGTLGGLRCTIDSPNWMQTGGPAPIVNQIQVEFFSPFAILVAYGPSVGNGGSGGNDAIIGWSAGHGEPFSTQIDWDQTIPTSPGAYSTGNGAVPLKIVADARPIIGTTVNLTLENIPQGGTGTFGGFVSGLAEYQTGLSLASIGMDGCNQYTDLLAVVLVVGAQATENWAFSIPNDPGLNGVEIKHTGAAFNPSPGVIPTTLGALSANGLKNTIGLQ